MGLRNKRPDLNGLLVVNKPLGWTSTRVVSLMRRLTSGAKVGHAGTLDPLATGVLIICVGKATRCVEQLMAEEKEYVAEIDLSRTSESHDLERATNDFLVERPPDMAAVVAALGGFVGSVMQLPPAHSAIKIDGRRAYHLARAGDLLEDHGGAADSGAGVPGRDHVGLSPDAATGEPTDVAAPRLKPRLVRIDAIEVVAYTWPMLTIRVCCGKGTYIRSLARDIGRALSTGGVLTRLERTRSGGYHVRDAAIIETLPGQIGARELLPVPVPCDPRPDEVKLF